MGELVAEIASCYVSAELGIPQGEGLGNHAAYLQNWLDALRNDRNYVFKAAKQASKVTDFLLGFVKKAETVKSDNRILPKDVRRMTNSRRYCLPSLLYNTGSGRLSRENPVVPLGR